MYISCVNVFLLFFLFISLTTRCSLQSEICSGKHSINSTRHSLMSWAKFLTLKCTFIAIYAVRFGFSFFSLGYAYEFLELNHCLSNIIYGSLTAWLCFMNYLQGVEFYWADLTIWHANDLVELTHYWIYQSYEDLFLNDIWYIIFYCT